MTPRGGPDGGDGGKGGDVILVATPKVNTLVDFSFKKKWRAQDGEAGRGSQQTGADGEDLRLEVPLGTLVFELPSRKLIADLTLPQEFLILKGGRGGKGNYFFRSSVNQAPEHAQPGEPGQEMEVELQLKLLADIGIIGYPNAGKSTLISRISASKAKVADYPFTTLTPNLGVVKISTGDSFVVADIPGLIPGAHLGHGLGIQFLKHIERTQALVHLLDVSELASEPADQIVDRLVEKYLSIRKELEIYDKQNQDKTWFKPLSRRAEILAVSKIELLPQDTLEPILQKLKKRLVEKLPKESLPKEMIGISSATGKNLDKLIYTMRALI
jgi:GTP-binding protein